jgi:hypothetical protein
MERQVTEQKKPVKVKKSGVDLGTENADLESKRLLNSVRRVADRTGEDHGWPGDYYFR